MDMSHHDKFARAVVMFLADGLRTRTVSTARGAEIAAKVLANINLIDTEVQFLSFVKELAHDFEELKPLESQLERNQALSGTRQLEEAIRQYALKAMLSDHMEAMQILKAAAQPDLSQDGIYAAFPKFKHYHEHDHAS